jgi:hypothetical protein
MIGMLQCFCLLLLRLAGNCSLVSSDLGIVFLTFSVGVWLCFPSAQRALTAD